MWQDYVFLVGTIIMTVFLIPTLKGYEKPATLTSFAMGVVLGVFALLFLTMDMWYTFVITTIESSLWFVLLYQKVRKNW